MARNRSFTSALRKATRSAWKNGDITRFEMARINIAIRTRPEAMAEVMHFVAGEAVDAGKSSSNSEIDWDALLAFIEKLLPLILQLIALF